MTRRGVGRLGAIASLMWAVSAAGADSSCSSQRSELADMSGRKSSAAARIEVLGVGAQGTVGPWTDQVTYRLVGAAPLDLTQVRVSLHSRNFSQEVTSDFRIAEGGNHLVMGQELLRRLRTGSVEIAGGATLTFTFTSASYEQFYRFEQPLVHAQACQVAGVQ